MPVKVVPVSISSLTPHLMPDRFRHDVTYFCTPAGTQGAPAKLPEREYWVRLDDSRQALHDGVIRIVSPLDSASTTEIEITEEQENWLRWMVQHQIEHIRLVPVAVDR